MVGDEAGSAHLTLLEFYGDNRREVELLADEPLLFLLSFIAEIRSATLPALAEELGWPIDELTGLVSSLISGGFVMQTLTEEIYVTESAKRFLRSAGLDFDLLAADNAAVQPALVSKWRPPFPPRFPVRDREEQAEYELGLMRAAQGGDADAFNALARELWPLIYMRNRWKLRNHADGQDATQIAFLNAWNRLADFRPPTEHPRFSNPVRSWFERIAFGVTRDLQRENAPRQNLGEELSPQELNRLESHEPDPEELSILREHHDAVSRGVLHEQLPPRQRAFHDAWEKLSSNERTLLGLRFWNGLSPSEIAEELGITVNSARTQVIRARIKLKRLMDARERDSDKKAPTIDSTRLSIMRELWRAQQSGVTAGLTQAQLAARIHVTALGISQFISYLLKDGLIIAGHAIRGPDQIGRTPRSYKINVHRVISSPWTARLVLRLAQATHDGIPYPRPRLLNDSIALGMLNPSLNEPFSETDIENMIDFAVNAGYVEDLGGARLLPTTRVTEEFEYLGFLTTQLPS